MTDALDLLILDIGEPEDEWRTPIRGTFLFQYIVVLPGLTGHDGL